MKKIISLSIVMLMVFALSVTVFAAQGNFVESPGKTNTTVTDVQTDIPDYNGKIVIVPYEKKATLPSQESQIMDQAYNDIADGQNNSNLGDVLGQNAGVYDLFDIHENGSFSNYNNGKYTITLAVGDVPNYKSIIYMDKDGTWHTVNDAVLSADGKTVTFTTTVLSAPYAIVVNKVTGSPKTGDVDLSIVYFALFASLVLGGLSVYKIKALKAK